MNDRPMIVDDLALFALQAGPITSSKMAKLFGISNLEAKRMLRVQVSAGYVVEEQLEGIRTFRLVEDDSEIILND